MRDEAAIASRFDSSAFERLLDDGRSPVEGGRLPVFGLLDNIRSVWNVGSMFRTADAAGLGGLLLCGMTATPPRPDIEKTALGATRTVPWNYWRSALEAAIAVREAGLPLVAPPLALCTDNAAMIAFAGLLALEAGRTDDMSLAARPRWPLDADAAPMVGSGKKGAKA